jgi:hypothetical protein
MRDHGNREVVLQDGSGITVVEHAPLVHAEPVPKDLLQSPPPWALTLIERGATFRELVEKLGEAAQRVHHAEEMSELIRVAEQLAQTAQGRSTIDLVLTPDFMPRLIASMIPRAVAAPAMIIYENADASGRSAWISPWEDETIYPVSTLQQLQLDQAVSAVWQNHERSFVELFLFDGTDLQGRFVRFARVKTSTPGLPVVLDDSALNNRCRSLLGSFRSSPGRRFSAEHHLGSVITSIFAQRANTPFGTIRLTEQPQFSWDGYAYWLGPSGYPPPPKTAGLRLVFLFAISDVLYGPVNGSMHMTVLFKRPGGTSPVLYSTMTSSSRVPAPWNGGLFEDFRWTHHIEGIKWAIMDAMESIIGQLAGPEPGHLLIFPGRSATIPSPPATHWGLIELGRTDEDATIVLSP